MTSRVVHVLFTEIAPKMAERPGGYLRITKIGNRKGDTSSHGRHRAGAGAVQAGCQEGDHHEGCKQPQQAPSREDQGEAPAEVTNVGEEAPRWSPWPRPSPRRSHVVGFARPRSSATTWPEALEDGSAPSEEFTIKGNKDSGKYHTPDSQWFHQTIAEVWFTTEEAAENAGFVKAG